MKTALLVLALVPTPALAQGAIDGVWRLNLQNTEYVGKETYAVEGGKFECSSCDPKYSVPADGADHPVSGSPYFDTVSVRVIDDRNIEIVQKKSKKPFATVKLAASADGKTLATQSSAINDAGQPINVKYSATRVGDAPASGHRVAGVWQPGKVEGASENIMEVTYKTTGDQLSMSDKAGNWYTARFDGKDYPYKGDVGISTVSLRKIDANTIEETFKLGSKVIGVARTSIAAGGRSLSVSFKDVARDVTMKWTADKK